MTSSRNRGIGKRAVPLAYGIGSLAKMVDGNPNIAAEIAAMRAILSRAGDRLRKSNRALHQFLDDVARARQAVERSRQLLKTGPKARYRVFLRAVSEQF